MPKRTVELSRYTHGRSEIWDRRSIVRALKREQRLVGARLRALRKEIDKSLLHAAEIVGIHPNHLGAIERGEINVSLGVLVACAKAYGVRVRDLFEE